MDKAQFMDELANILDESRVDDSLCLKNNQAWDSLAILSVASLAASKFGFSLHAVDVKGLDTVADLWAFFEKNRTK